MRCFIVLLIPSQVGFIIDAVYTIVDAVKAASARKCFGKIALCDDFLNSADKNYIINDEMKKVGGGQMYNATTGDPKIARYQILTLRRPSGNNAKHFYDKVNYSLVKINCNAGQQNAILPL